MDYVQAGKYLYDAYQAFAPYWPRFTKAAQKKFGKRAGRGRRPFRGTLSGPRQRQLRIPPEIHYVDLSISGAPPVGGSVTCLNSIAQGDDYNNRDGRILAGHAISYSIVLHCPDNAAAADSYQIAFVYDTTPATGTPTYADIFDTTVLAVGTAFLNLKTMAGRFVIVREFRGTLQQGGAMTVGRLNGTLRIPARLARSVYAAAAADDPESGGWYIVIASAANTANIQTSVNISAQLRFMYVDV